MLQPIIEPQSVMDFFRGFKEKAVAEDDGVIPMLMFLDCPELAPDDDDDMRGVAIVVIPTTVPTSALHDLFTKLKTDGPLVGKDVLGVGLASDTYYAALPDGSTMDDVVALKSHGSLAQLYQEGHPHVKEALSVSVLRQDGVMSTLTLPYGTNDDGSLRWEEPVDYGDQTSTEGTVPEAMAVLLS